MEEQTTERKVKWTPVKRNGVLMWMLCFANNAFTWRLPTLKEYEEHGSATWKAQKEE